VTTRELADRLGVSVSIMAMLMAESGEAGIVEPTPHPLRWLIQIAYSDMNPTNPESVAQDG
jgi:hypothetical protein